MNLIRVGNIIINMDNVASILVDTSYWNDAARDVTPGGVMVHYINGGHDLFTGEEAEALRYLFVGNGDLFVPDLVQISEHKKEQAR